MIAMISVKQNLKKRKEKKVKISVEILTGEVLVLHRYVRLHYSDNIAGIPTGHRVFCNTG